jgi:predicted nucleotidyltransferase component of viral defense system
MDNEKGRAKMKEAKDYMKTSNMSFFGTSHAASEYLVVKDDVLPSLEIDYKNIYGVKIKVRVMDIREITAEKISAMSDRARYRDYYDFVMIKRNLKIDINEVLNLVRKKEIRKTIYKNWDIAKLDKQAESLTIYFTKELSDKEIEKELKKLKFGDIEKLV